MDRDQLFLMPPSVAEWLPEGHLAWFVLDAVEQFDLSLFVAGYRGDGRGGAAYHPAMMVGLLVYAYAVGERSSRRIERRCVEDVAFRAAAMNRAPDHATIARFRVAHEQALAGLFGQVLLLCERAGLVRAGLLAVDGTKMGANASKDQNRTGEQLAREILAEAAAADAAEDDAFGDRRGDELPQEMVGPGRKAKLRALLDELEAEQAVNSFESRMAQRADQEAVTGRKPRGRAPAKESWDRRHQGRQQTNLTDPESRLIRDKGRFIQGFNAQAVATEGQIVVAAAVTNEVVDTGQFQPMVAAAQHNLDSCGTPPGEATVLADAGYWSDDNAHTPGIDAVIAPGGHRRLGQLSDDQARREGVLGQAEQGQITPAQAAAALELTTSRLNELLRRRRRGLPETPTAEMIAKLDTDRAKQLYKKRSAMIEPVFAQIKHNRGIRGFMRRGLNAADSEWKLITATHNLLKLHKLATSA